MQSLWQIYKDCTIDIGRKFAFCLNTPLRSFHSSHNYFYPHLNQYGVSPLSMTPGFFPQYEYVRWNNYKHICLQTWSDTRHTSLLASSVSSDREEIAQRYYIPAVTCRELIREIKYETPVSTNHTSVSN